jgi:N-acetylglucosaminyldiphosphoundecaprenol N-acetyl-beta-D-mannosaminyltransferase
MTAIVSIGGIPFEATTIERSVDSLITTARTTGTSIRLANTYNVALANRDPAYFTLLAASGKNLPDGKPIALMQRVLGHPLAEQVRGPSFFRLAMDRGRAVGIRHFMLGGTTEDELALVLQAAEQLFPGVEIVGAVVPPFCEVHEFDFDDWARQISDAEADVVWVGLGSPKQDYVTARLAEMTGRSSIGVGAAFSFLAGTRSEAPKIFQSIGMEWLYRLFSEPHRLWRRYAFGLGLFAALSIRDIARAHRDKYYRRK